MHRLQTEGVICAVIDPQTHGTSPREEQWYAGTIKGLLKQVGLTDRLDFSRWWKERQAQELSALKRFDEFVDQMLLVRSAIGS